MELPGIEAGGRKERVKSPAWKTGEQHCHQPRWMVDRGRGGQSGELMDSDCKLLSLRDLRCLFPRGEAQKDLGTQK